MTNYISEDAAYPAPRFIESDRRLRILDACPQLEAIFGRYAAAEQMPGMAYGVVVEDELVFTHTLGLANLTTQTPVAADTVFRIASMTKSFAALAVLMLRDAGRLRLDDPVAFHVPELADLSAPTGDSPAITVRHLLTMSAGFPTDDPWGDRQLYRDDAAMSALYRAGLVFAHPPGVTFEYSNLGYMLLGRVVANAGGEPFMDFVNRAILRPLGMSATVWNASDAPADRLALGYRWEDERWTPEPMLPSGGDVAAFAGLFTSVNDLARWVALFLGAWPPRSDEESSVVRRSTLREMQQVSRFYGAWLADPRLGEPAKVGASGYGLGLSIVHNGKWESVGHGGGLPGFGSHMRWSPQHGVGVIGLSNVTYGDAHSACHEALELLARASQVQPRARRPAPALSQAREAVLRFMESRDDTLADALFADNFFLDKDREHWRRDLEKLRQQHGALHPEGELIAESWLSGKWKMVGEQGWCWVFIRLSPLQPPLVQTLEVESTLPPSPEMLACAGEVARLVARPLRGQLQRICGEKAEVNALWERVRLAHALVGRCKVGEAVAGDGAGKATLRLVGGKVEANVELTLDEGGKLRDAVFRPAGG
jgi:CubicO group peptidase (beta-lactamase class C family)